MGKVSTKEKREQKRIDEILNAAQEVFLEKGFYGATVNDIAERALTSKFTVYQYFKGKDTILNAILARGYTILTHVVEKTIEDVDEPKQRLLTLIHAELEFFEKRKDFFEMLFVEKLDFENEVKNNILPSFQEHMNFIEKEFRNNVRRGFIRLVDPEDAAYMVFATLRAYSLRWLFQGMKGKLTDKRDVIYDLVMKGLSAE